MKPDYNLSIFIVEDNEMYSFMLERKLHDQINYGIANYTTGEACIKDLYLNPDIVILDYNLPGINGMEALKALKEKKPKLHVIILSSQTNLQAVADLMKEGAYDYIQKNKETLVKITEAIENIRRMSFE